MEIDTQEYEVTLKFKYTGPVFEDDPDDRFELAGFEKEDLERLILNHFDGCEISQFQLTPVITPGK